MSSEFPTCVNVLGLDFCELCIHNLTVLPHFWVSNILPHLREQRVAHNECLMNIDFLPLPWHVVNLLYSPIASSLTHIIDILTSGTHLGQSQDLIFLMSEVRDA